MLPTEVKIGDSDATYRSEITANEITHSCGEEILLVITSKFQGSEY